MLRLAILACLLAGCASAPRPQYIYIKQPPIVRRCKLPPRPHDLPRPLPVSERVLLEELTSKLVEWNSYGDRVERACR